MPLILARIACLWLAVSALAACSNVNGILDASENRLRVGTVPPFDSDLRIFHAALLDPAGLRLALPGYIIGIENTGGFTGGRQITHVLRYDGGETKPMASLAPPCTVYSEFRYEAQARENGEAVAECSTADGSIFSRVKQSLKQDLALGQYSQIIVMVMGWNTDQSDAVVNFNQLSRNIMAAAAADRQASAPFNPLVIGITWPSEWVVGGWVIDSPTLLQGASFWAKKDEADDVGRRFISAIMTQAVLPARAEARPQTQLVMIGHSFGARALAAMLPNWKGLWFGMTPANVEARYVSPDPTQLSFRPQDRLILLEGAFDIDEMFPHGVPLPTLRQTHLPLTMTASRFDTANSLAIWGDYVGDYHTWQRVCSHEPGIAPRSVPDVACSEAYRPQQWGFAVCNEVPPAPAPAPINQAVIRYFDASRMINCGSPTGLSGAHDDFNRRESGRFIYNDIVHRENFQ